MAIRISKEQQEAFGFSNPREFSDALNKFENAGGTIGNLFGDSAKDIIETPTSPNFDTGSPEVSLEDVGTTPLSTPQGGDAQSRTNSTIEDIQDTIVSIAGDQSPEEERAEDRLREAEESLFRAEGLVSDEAQDRAGLEEQLGVSEAEQEIFDIASTIQLKSASLRQGLVDQEGRPIAMPFITGRQAQMKKQAAAEIEGLAAVAQAQQNKILAAESRIDRALTRKYGDIESRINQARTFLSINESRFSRAEKKAAEKRSAELSILENKIESRRDMEKEALSYISNAVQNGFSPEEAGELTQKVLSGKIGMSQVVAETGNFQTDPIDRQIKRAQLQKVLQELDGDNGKDLSQAEKQALGFGERALSSDIIISEIGNQFTGTLDRISGAGLFPTGFKSSDRQRYEQAQRNFVNAVLRQESGAAIAEEEFESARQQYFPQPGDKEAVILQKKQNREQVIKNLLEQGGVDTTEIDMSIEDPLGIGTQGINDNPLEL